MTRLIVNADDFGYSKGVNLGIIEAFQNGIVTSTTMMTTMPEIEHAAALAKENPKLNVGIHFVLTTGKPLSTNVPTLVGADHQFHKQLELSMHAKPEDIEKECRAQLERFLTLDLTPSHFDSHHHVHHDGIVYPIIEKLAIEFNVPIRRPLEKYNYSKTAYQINLQVKMVENFNDNFYGTDLTEKKLLEILDQVKLYQSAEIMTHPAYIDQALYRGTSYALPRTNELEILTSIHAQKAINERQIQLIGYQNL